jgi:hypothetical protein
MTSAWNAYITDSGDLWAAFVQGHVEIESLLDDADERIVEAYAEQHEDYAAETRNVLEDAGGAVITHFWLKPIDEEMYGFAEPTDEKAFPVTGMRFWR